MILKLALHHIIRQSILIKYLVHKIRPGLVEMMDASHYPPAGTLIVRVALRARPTCLCARLDLSDQHVGPTISDMLLRKVRLENMARWSAGVTFAAFGLPRPCLWPGHAPLDGVF